MKKYNYLLSYVKKKKVFMLVVLLIVSSFITLCPPYITKFLLDNGVAIFSVETVVFGRSEERRVGKEC